MRLVTELYGSGLARILELAEQATGPADLVARMADDEVVGSLLVVHDLHPELSAPASPAFAHVGAPAGPSSTPVHPTRKTAPVGAQS